jgi:mannose-1-phosphate guanylyltransferase
MEPTISTMIITPVILSGGSGTRLWPLSRSQKPKQLLALTGERTMLQMTAARCPEGDLFGPAIIVTNAAHADEIATQMRDCPPAAMILEPAGRNTAPAIALAALAAEPGALLLAMASDHVIADVPAFHAAVRAGMTLAQDGWLITLGITPDKPETGYGYIRRGEAITAGVHRVEAFVEKPDAERAATYLAEGNYSWNASIFLFRADAYLAALELYEPAMLASVKAAFDGADRDGTTIRPAREAFLSARSESIDYAVMEKAERVAVVPVEMGWSDVGSWDALHELGLSDEHGNVTHGDVVTIDSSGNLVRSEGPVVTLAGVHDLIVVATRDAVMVLPRGSSQEVKKIVEKLKEKGHTTLDAPF